MFLESNKKMPIRAGNPAVLHIPLHLFPVEEEDDHFRHGDLAGDLAGSRVVCLGLFWHGLKTFNSFQFG